MKDLLFLTFKLLAIYVCCVAIAQANEKTNSPLKDETVIAEQDLIFQGIQGLVGETANIIVGADAPDKPDHMIAVLSNIFNYGMLSIALLFMAVRGVVWLGQLNSEKKEGTMLDFQSAPVAVIMAIIVLLPFPNGYSILQHTVIKMAGFSISIANQETNALAEFMDKTGSYSISPSIMNADMIALNMLDSAICLSAINKVTKRSNVGVNKTFKTDLANDIYMYNTTYDGLFTIDEAQSLYKADLASGFANGVTTHYPKRVCGFSRISFGALDENYVSSNVVIDFRKSMTSAYEKMRNEIFFLGSDFVEHLLEPVSIDENGPIFNRTYPSSMEMQIKSASKAFKDTYQTELESLVSRIKDEGTDDGSALTSKRATDNLKKYGTGFLGVYFWEYARRNNVITNLTQVNKSSRPPDWSYLRASVDADTATLIVNQKSALIKNIRTDYIEEMPEVTTNERVDINSNIERFVTNTVETAEHGYDLSAAGGIFKVITSSIYDESDPFLAMSNFGHNLIVTGESAVVASQVTKNAAQIAKASLEGTAMAAASTPFTGVGAIPARIGVVPFDIAIEVSDLVTNLGIIIISFGALVAFWIPSIPLYHWVAGMMGFMIVFMQAFVLTPLLALAHLLSGEKGFFSSKTQHGYMAIIQLATYLPIMVIAFVVAYLVTMWGAKFLQVVYLPALEIISANSIGGVMTTLFVTAIFIIFNIQIANRGFSLITTMAEKAGKFIGGGEEMLGDSQGAGSAKGAFVAFQSNSTQGMKQAVASKTKTSNKQNQNDKQKTNAST